MYFKVAITDGQTFPPNTRIVWGNVQENVGGGYDAASEKFAVPQAGTYHFTVTIMNKNPSDLAYMSLKTDGIHLCSALAAGQGSFLQMGVCTRVVQLAAGEDVWVINPDWSEVGEFHRDYTTFEGFMIHGNI